MVYLWIFLGLIISCIMLAVANVILKRIKNKRADTKEKKGDK